MNRNQRLQEIIRRLRNRTRSMQEPVVEQVARKRDPYRVLLSTMLSLRTKDEVTRGASLRLFSKAPTMQKLARLPLKVIRRLIYPVGFYPTKARHCQQVARFLVKTNKGKVPRTRSALLALPGVGRKVANLVLSLSFNIPAICVDTHVHRISNRLGLVKTSTPEETEYALMKILPQKNWINWNAWLVMWGQQICQPLSPRCSQCALAEFCPRRGVTSSR